MENLFNKYEPGELIILKRFSNEFQSILLLVTSKCYRTNGRYRCIDFTGTNIELFYTNSQVFKDAIKI